MWERRIAIISTNYFITRRNFHDTMRIAALLLNDKEDLIHKAVGWMLREIGNVDQTAEEKFLKSIIKKCQEQCFAMQSKNFLRNRGHFIWVSILTFNELQSDVLQ